MPGIEFGRGKWWKNQEIFRICNANMPIGSSGLYVFLYIFLIFDYPMVLRYSTGMYSIG